MVGQVKRGVQPYAKEKWKLKEPFEQKVFIENNEGQFDGKAGDENTKILFNTRISGVDVYFTPKGIVYRHDQYPELGSKDMDEDKERNITPTTYLFREEWEGANSSPDVIAEDEVSFYYCYPKSCKHTTIAHAFKKLLYKNIYPGIDVEYSFKENKKGIEYRIIVSPGADLSKVKLVYPDAKSITKGVNGDIEMKGAMGMFTDCAPEKTFCSEGGKKVSAWHELNGNEERFVTGAYDHSKTLIIDPFKTNPTFTGYNGAYDVCYDVNGNVYAYGSFNCWQEAKINNAGALQWIFNAVFPGSWGGIQYADFAVDEVTGSSYVTSSGYPIIIKVNQAGKQTDSIDVSSQMNEIWRMAYNHCEGHLIIGGGGTAGDYQLATLDTSLTTFNPVNVLGTSGGHHDVSLLCIDNTNKDVFFAMAQSNVSASWNNSLIKSPIPAFLPMAFSTLSDGYPFFEGATISYVDGVAGHTCAMNGIVASPDWLYLYDGDSLSRFNKNTGAFISAQVINPHRFNWGGIDVDLCDHLYVGNDSVINVYDSALAVTGVINPGYRVFDLHIMPNNGLCVAGLGFVSEYGITTNAMSISKARTSAGCGVFNGTASAKLTGCGSDSSQYNYLWSTGATTQQISGLAPGTYTITISSGCDFKFTDTVNIQGGNNGGMTLNTTQTNIQCFGDSNGSANVIVTGGKAPYTYSWTPGGATTSGISGLKAGTYVVTVSDSAGCNSATVIITQPAQLIVSIVSSTNVGCKGGNTGAAVAGATGGTGAYTYSWSPTGGNAASASNLSAGVYTVNVTDANGCKGQVVDSIKQTTIPVPVITGTGTVCAGSPIVLTASGGSTYLWNNGATTSSITVSPTVNTTYSVEASNGPCTADTSFSVAIIPLPKITLTTTATALCNGDSAVLNVGGAATYLWSTGSTATSITVKPVTTTTYSVQASDGVCTTDTSVTIVVNTKPAVVVSGTEVICYGAETTLSASGAETYKWIPGTGLNCDTCPNVLANPTSTITYTVIGYNGGCTDTALASIKVSPRPKGTACCSDTIQMGDTVTIYALDSSAVSVSWSPVSNIACNTCPATKVSPEFTTTYTVVMTDSSGCEVVDSVNIFVEGCSTIWIPDAFTPNGDGLNDVFEPKGVCIVSYSMYIFDRWGELLYYTPNGKPWNGMFKNAPVQEDTYVYKIVEEDGYRKMHTYIGRVTVIH